MRSIVHMLEDQAGRRAQGGGAQGDEAGRRGGEAGLWGDAASGRGAATGTFLAQREYDVLALRDEDDRGVVHLGLG